MFGINLGSVVECIFQLIKAYRSVPPCTVSLLKFMSGKIRCDTPGRSLLSTLSEILDDTVEPRMACPCRLLDIGCGGDQQRSISVSHGKEKKRHLRTTD